MIGYETLDWLEPGSEEFEAVLSCLVVPLAYRVPLFIRESTSYGCAYEAMWVTPLSSKVTDLGYPYMLSFHASNGELMAVNWGKSWEEMMELFCDGDD